MPDTLPDDRVREHPVTLHAAGFALPARLTVPAGGGPSAALLLVPGSLFSNVDGDYPHWNVFPHMYAHLARQLAARGIAVFRYAKSGPGTDAVTVDAAEVARHRGDFLVRVRIAERALEQMYELLLILGLITPRIVIAGHSEGAVVASLLAPRAPPVRGLILLAGPSVGILEIMREQHPAFMPAGRQEEAMRTIDEVIATIRRGDPLSPGLRASPYAGALAQMDEVGLSYMRTCDAVNPVDAVRAVRQPVLVLQGARDGSVPPHHAHRLHEARAGRDSELVVLPQLQHFFKPLPDGLSGMEAFALAGDVDPRVAATIHGWVDALPP
jgi:uncharacterized protein